MTSAPAAHAVRVRMSVVSAAVPAGAIAAWAVMIGTASIARGNIETTYVDDNNWTYRCYYLPDNDQRRDLLLNEGRTYCVPTSAYNALSYIAAHGYPEVWPGDHSYTWWLDPANYDSATGQIGTLGTIMGTDPWNGGTSGAGEMAGLTAMLDTGDFIVGRVSTFLQLENLAPVAGSKPLILLSIGWYPDTVPASRDGGHKVMLDEVIRSGGTRLIGFRDPSTDEDGSEIDLDAQSMYRSSRYNVVHEERWIVQNGITLLREVDRIEGMMSGSKVGLLGGYTFIVPAHGFTMSLDFAEFIYHQPTAFDFDADWVPEHHFPVNVGDVIRGIVMNPATLEPHILATDSGTGVSGLYRINLQTGEQLHRATLSNPWGMDIGRNRRVYVLEDSGMTLRCLNIDGEFDAIEEATLTMPEAVKAVAYDDSTDQLYLPAVSSMAIYMVDADSLTVAAVSQRPAGTSLVGTTYAAVSSVPPDDGRLWLAAALSPNLLGLDLVPGGTANAIEVPHGVSSPSGIQVDDLNRVHVIADGIVHAYQDLGGTSGWGETTDTPFAGLPAAGGLCLARSRTDFEPWMTGPDWADVLPTTVLEGPAACLEDITGPGGVPDGSVGVLDLLILLAEWGEPDSIADVAPDGSVNVGDLLVLLAAWGLCAP